MPKQSLVAALAALALVGGSQLASAGAKKYMPVKATPWTTNPNLMNVMGSASGTRNTPDLVQFVECNADANNGGCVFRDAGGKFYSCFTTDPGLISVIRSMQGDSVIDYDYEISTAKCIFISTGAHSQSEPKAP
jgi:hypothetical protein